MASFLKQCDVLRRVAWRGVHFASFGSQNVRPLDGTLCILRFTAEDGSEDGLVWMSASLSGRKRES